MQTVLAFIQTHKLPGLVTTDPSHDLIAEFGIPGLPTTVLIYPTGTVAAITLPLSLTKERLRALLEGIPLALPDIRIHNILPLVAREQTSVRAQFAASVGRNEMKMVSADRYVATAVPLRTLLSWAYTISPFRIAITTSLEQARYDVDLSAPMHDSDELCALMKAVPIAGTAISVSFTTHLIRVIVCLRER